MAAQEPRRPTPHETPADARRAASLLFLRDGDDGIELLMLRRAERDGDLRSGACVFPGGVLDSADRRAHLFVLGPGDAEASARLGLPDGGLDYLVAAVRESFEEVGLLLACGRDGAPADLSAHRAALAAWRLRLQQGQGSMAELCESLDLRLDLRGLNYFSHWLTPPGLPKRFDTRFFTALAPQGQQAVADLGEAVDLLWTTPRAALSPDSGFKLLPVTRRTLEQIARHPDAAAAHAAAAAQPQIPLTMPRRGATRRGPRVVLPDEPAYAEIARLDPDGLNPASCEIVPGVPVQLSPRVLRITAPNPGMMTGPGTNSYLLPGDGAWTVIDPGPDDASHREALLAATGGRVANILVTHTHPDHSPGAAALQRASGARLIGRRAPPHPGQDHGFAPDHEPADGERLTLAAGTTLLVVHTPGHASNHLCYLLEQEKTLFTGDHVMQGSTVVINPPDGDMAAYLRALEALLPVDLDWFAPGHGFLVADPHRLLRALIAHRLQRESRVLAALREAGPGDLAALVPRVYADVPESRHTIAQRSLLAHLIKLRDDGAVAESQGRWSAL